jgi:hypothetical protein
MSDSHTIFLPAPQLRLHFQPDGLLSDLNEGTGKRHSWHSVSYAIPKQMTVSPSLCACANTSEAGQLSRYSE